MKFLWVIIFAGYAICVAEAIFNLTAKKPVARRFGTVPLAVALTAHTLWLLFRGVREERLPVAGSQEMCAFLAWALAVAVLIASRWYKANALRAFIIPIVLILTSIAAVAPPTPGEPVTVDSLYDQVFFTLHAGLILLAYATFFISFGSGLMYIIQERELKSKRFGRIFYRLPSLETCDEISYKALSIGFLLLTLGIASGVAWLRARDGVLWHGDPTEIFSVVTWLIYLLLLQSRWNAGWSGRTTALASIVSFMIVIFSLVGLRYLGTLHGLG